MSIGEVIKAGKAIGNRNKRVQELRGRVELLNYNNGILNSKYSIYRLEGLSGVNKIYEYEIIFISEDKLDITAIVDTDIKIILEDITNRTNKTIYGKVFSIKEESIVSKKSLYKVKVVHPLYYLGLTNSYEIFHNLSTVDIIQSIISRYSSLLNLSCVNNIDKSEYSQDNGIKEYTTQYNQSDLEFIKMLCEEEGYSLVIDSQEPNFKVVICDLNEYSNRMSVSNRVIGTFNNKIEFKATHFIEDYYDKNNPNLEFKIRSGEVINPKENTSSKQLRDGIVKEKLRDKLNLLNESYYEDLNRYSKLDSEIEYSLSNTIEAFSNDLIIDDSKLINLYDDKVNKSQEIIVLEVKSKAYFPNALDEYVDIESSTQKFEMQYSVELKAIPKDIIYRPQRTIKKPKIYGIQTAIVTSQDINNQSLKEKANSIDVDEEGRVRVLFFFERNKIASCYLRVSNMSSGDNYGTMFIPRVNSEVIVSFVNGDPDCPIIIGTLHNGENKLAYSLPNNKTKSYIRTYTTPQYSDSIGYNEVMFEDYQGKEEINIRAQRDLNTEVLNNENKRVDKDQRVIIRGDKEESINKNSKLNVKENYEINIQNDFIENVINNKQINVSENLDLNVNKTNTIVVNENINYNVQNNLVRTIQGYVHRYVEQDKKEKFLQNLYEEVSKSFGINIKNYHLKSNDNKQESNEINIEAYEEVVLRCGSNALIINQSGIEFKTSKYESNSSNGGINSNEVGIEGEVINLRFIDSNKDLTSMLEEDICLLAETTLKNGKIVEISLILKDSNNIKLAIDVCTAKVQNERIEMRYSYEELINKYGLEKNSIDILEAKIKW
ncbi:aspartate carbamoyltransferase catalytic subunit [Aliarcobacter thereius]|nr:aspartate carbamoyltransferase catalytic subunit [Aliarcobacter thereius]